jgi:hypothetical protein
MTKTSSNTQTLTKADETDTAVAAPVQHGMPAGFGDFAGLKIIGTEVTEVKAVTRPVLVQEDNKPFAVRIISHIYRGQELKKKRGSGVEMAPANLCHVIDMETGEEKTLICNTVLHSELDRAFPNHGYVGRYFAIKSVKGETKDKSRSLRRYNIMEFKVGHDVGELADIKLLPAPVSLNDSADDGEEEGENAAE